MQGEDVVHKLLRWLLNIESPAHVRILYTEDGLSISSIHQGDGSFHGTVRAAKIRLLDIGTHER